MAVANDGRMYAVQVRERQVGVYDHSGKFVASFGRQGQGPGEFGSIGGIGLKGDTVWVYDSSNQRLSFWTRDGQLILEFKLDIGSPDSTHNRGAPGALLANGELLVRHSGNVEAPDGKPVVPSDIWRRTTRDGSFLDSVATISFPRIGVWFTSEFRGEMVQTYVPEPFRDEPRVGLMPDAQVVIVDRPAATGPDSAMIRVNTVDPLTRQRIVREYGYTPQPLNGASIDSVLQRRAGGDKATPEGRRNADRLRERMYVPSFLPLITDLKVGNDGSLWMQRGWSDKKWIVLDKRGVPLAVVALPAQLTPLRVTATNVWGYEESPEGVPQVVRYRVLNHR